MARKGINKVIVLGNLGQDPEVKYMANGNAVTNISIATSESWQDKQSGQQQERTEWHRVVFFGKLAEIAGEYLRKGSKVYVEGSLKTDKWQDNNGNDRYTTNIVGSEMQMLDSKPENSAPRQQAAQQPQQAAQQQTEYQGHHHPQQATQNSPPNSQSMEQQAGAGQAPQGSEFDDGIPF